MVTNDNLKIYKNGIVYINVNGHGAGNAEEMRKNMQHDGSHGTYVNKDVDEDSAKKVGQINGDRTESNLIADESIKDKIKEGTDAYNKAVENGDIRNLLEMVEKNRLLNGKENKALNEIYGIGNGKVDYNKIVKDYHFGDLEDLEAAVNKVESRLAKERLLEDGLITLFGSIGFKKEALAVGATKKFAEAYLDLLIKSPKNASQRALFIASAIEIERKKMSQSAFELENQIMSNYVSYDGKINVNNGNKLTGLNLNSSDVDRMIKRQNEYSAAIRKNPIIVPSTYIRSGSLNQSAGSDMKKLNLGNGL